MHSYCLTYLLLPQVISSCDACCFTSHGIKTGSWVTLPQSLSSDQGVLFQRVTCKVGKGWCLKARQDMHYRVLLLSCDNCIKQQAKVVPEYLCPRDDAIIFTSSKIRNPQIILLLLLFHLSCKYKSSRKFIPTNSYSAQVLHKPAGLLDSANENEAFPFYHIYKPA